MNEAGDVDARKLNSPEAQEVIRAADEAIMSRDALAGEIEQTVEDEKNAPSPGEALEAMERRRQLSWYVLQTTDNQKGWCKYYAANTRSNSTGVR